MLFNDRTWATISDTILLDMVMVSVETKNSDTPAGLL